jgi:predicted deacylase
MLRLTLVGVVFFLVVSPIVHAQSKFSVGTASAAPGQKSTGFLEVPAGVDAATSIPVVVVNGAKPGKVLALVSGAHGTEYVSIIAIEKLISALDPAQVTGTVILVPLINIQSFEQKVPHVNPVDNKSMNRFYPGKADGTQTERASYLITKEIVDRCDYLIDYHGGDLDESLRPYAYWGPTGREEQDRVSKQMVLPLASITSSFGASAPPTPPPLAISITPPPSVASLPSSLKPVTPAPSTLTTSRSSSTALSAPCAP